MQPLETRRPGFENRYCSASRTCLGPKAKQNVLTQHRTHRAQLVPAMLGHLDTGPSAEPGFSQIDKFEDRITEAAALLQEPVWLTPGLDNPPVVVEA